MKDQEVFKSPDIALCAYLSVRGHKLLDIVKNGHQGYFIFDDSKTAKDRLCYLNGEGQVEPGAYNLSIRRLKATLQ